MATVKQLTAGNFSKFGGNYFYTGGGKAAPPIEAPPHALKKLALVIGYFEFNKKVINLKIEEFEALIFNDNIKQEEILK